MKTSKPFFASIGVMSPLVSLVVVALRVIWGINVDESLLTTIASQLQDMYSLGILVIGQLGAIYGRITATKQIGGRA